MAYVSTETTRRVRGELKQRFPNLKFSVSKKDGTLRVRIMAGDLDFRDIWEDIPDNKQYWKRYGNPKPHFDGYVSINTYHPDDYNPKYTDLFKQIISIMKGTEWFDNSDPQIDYFSTAYYLKLSVGKWDKPYQYTGTPRMADLFRRFNGEEDEHIHKYEPMRDEKDYMICRGCDGILHKDLIDYLYHQCPRCDCAYCNPMGLSEGERAKERMKVIMSYYDAGLMPYINRANAEEFRGEESMHPNWCSNCGMKNDGCINLGYGDWYCMNFLNNRETYDGRYDRFRGEAFEAQLSEYLYKCDACGHITDVRFSDVYSDKYCREACARGRPEKCRGSCGKNGWDVDFTGVYHAGLRQTPSIDTKYGVNIICKDCGIGFYGDARWELYDELPDKSQAEEYEAESEVECNDCGKSFNLSETKTWIDDERYCANCLDFQRKQTLKDDEALQREEENERIVRAIRRDRGDEYYAEGEDMTLKDSAKLGFGLGAGLLGFKVALLGASALVGGLLLNRKE